MTELPENDEQDAGKDLGPQPIDELMTRLGMANTDMVRASTEQLTHKMVAKARKGRFLTLKIREKILRALTAARPEQTFSLRDLFNYK